MSERKTEDYLLGLRKAIDVLFQSRGRTSAYLEAKRYLALVEMKIMDLRRKVGEVSRVYRENDFVIEEDDEGDWIWSEADGEKETK